MEKNTLKQEKKVNTRTAMDEDSKSSFGGSARQKGFGPAAHDSQENFGVRTPDKTSTTGMSGSFGKAIAVFVVVVSVVIAFTFLGGKKDNVDTQTQQQWAAGFIAAQPMRIKLVESSQVPAAIVNIQMPETEKQKLQNEINVGRTRLVWVDLRDNYAEDGDIVRIDSGNFSQTISIKNAGARIPVPEPPSGVLNVVGIHDGGGGITVEMMSGNTPVNLPLMSVGQAIGVPVLPSP